MFSKWIIAVTLSLYSVLATTARAESHIAKLSSGDVLRSLADEVHTSAKIPVNLETYARLNEESPRRVESILKNLKADGAAEVIHKFAEKCRLSSVKEIAIGSSTYVNDGGTFVLDHELKNPLITLKKKTSDCEAMFESFDRAKEVLLPQYELILSGSDVLRDEFNVKRMAAWGDELRSTSFSAALSAFEASCRHDVNAVEITTFTGYDSVYSNLKIDIDQRPQSARKLILGAAKACAKVMGPLVELNDSFAIEQGLLFHFEADDFLAKKVNANDVLKWIRYFSEKTTRLSDLSGSILNKARSSKSRVLRACGQDCRLFARVSFSQYTDFPSRNGLTSLVDAVTRVIVPYMAFIDRTDQSEIKTRITDKYNAFLDSSVRIGASSKREPIRF